MLAVEVAESGQSKMDEIMQLIKGDLMDISRLYSVCDHQLIKQVHVLSLKKLIVFCGNATLTVSYLY